VRAFRLPKALEINVRILCIIVLSEDSKSYYKYKKIKTNINRNFVYFDGNRVLNQMCSVSNINALDGEQTSLSLFSCFFVPKSYGRYFYVAFFLLCTDCKFNRCVDMSIITRNRLHLTI
jgi:hypothetical protein